MITNLNSNLITSRYEDRGQYNLNAISRPLFLLTKTDSCSNTTSTLNTSTLTLSTDKQSTLEAFISQRLLKDQLWHRCLSHMNMNNLHLLFKLNIMYGIPNIKKTKYICETCIMGKYHQVPFRLNRRDWRD